MNKKIIFHAGQVIFVEGEPGEDLFIIESGEVLLMKEESGKVSPLCKIEAGGFLGELSAFSQRRTRSLCAIALQDTNVYRVAFKDVQKVLELCPDWVSEVMQLLSDRLKASTDIMKQHRIASEEIELYAETHAPELSMYQKQISDYRKKNGLIL